MSVHVAGAVHVPQLPPQPSSPQLLAEQFGVQPIVVVVVEVVVVVLVVPQTPNMARARPGGGAGLEHVPLQQLMFVAHRVPSVLQPPSARTSCGQAPSNASKATRSENRSNHVVGAE